MQNGRYLLSGRQKYLCGMILLLVGCAICTAFGTTGNDDFNMARREVLLRSIGHELLLRSGDSTSRVLPVKRISANEYRIGFEKDLIFQTDYLVNVTQQVLAKDPQAGDYVVSVLNCGNESVAYGYAVSENGKNNIVPCRGRIQPKGCYQIDIKFNPTGVAIIRIKKGYLLGSLPFLAFIGFVFFKPGKPKNSPENDQRTGVFTFGAVLFDPKGRQLVINKQTIELTGTETRLLHIFASSPNKIIDRSRLQKEIWEDEGVIVGRSLDMFISKLRKKLETDPDTKIVVVRGKGYRLETVSE